MKKPYKKHEEEEKPAIVNEPIAAYYAEEDVMADELPMDVLLELAELAVLEVKDGKGYSTLEAMEIIDKEMAWK